jgi:hypothetical protein
MHARLVEPCDVHVTLHDEETLEGQARLPHLVKTVEFPALVEECGFGGVEVFGLAPIDDATTEADHATPGIPDRKHDAIPEAVVVRILPGGRSLALDDEPRREQRAARWFGGAKTPQHFMPGIRCVADAELLQGLGEQTAIAQIDAGALVVLELLGVEACDATQDIRESFGAGAPRGHARFTRNLEPQALGQLLHGFRKRQLLILHQETERRAVDTAAEAVEELFVGADPERGCLLVVEWTAGLEFAPGFLQRDAFADQLDDVCTTDQLIDEVLGDAAGHAGSLTAAGVPPVRVNPDWRDVP